MSDSRNKRLMKMLAILLFCCSEAVFAGTNGKITGAIKDKETGDALPGVNVILDGTSMGAATNAKGEFSVINVPAGVYSVSTSMIGYTKITKQNVRVLPDFTTRLDFDLSAEALSGEEVVIIVDRPLIQKDQTMTMAVTSSDEIKNLPIRGFQAAANLGSGFVIDATTRNLDGGTGNVNVRGGRPSETGVYLDGFLQNNLLTGVSNVQVSNSAVEEVVAITGGFNAEFGRNQSGIIQVITKSGATRYSGSAEYVTDRVAPAFSTGKFGFDNISGGFGGPLIPGNNKIKFYLSGEMQKFDDSEPSVFGNPYYRTDTTGSAGLTWADHTRYTEEAYHQLSQDTIYFTDANGNIVDHPVYSKKKARPGRVNAFDYQTFQAKLSYNVTSSFRLDLSGNLGENIKKRFISSRTFNQHVERRENAYFQVGGLANYSINDRSFVELGGNFNSNRQRLMDDEIGWDINWAFDTRDSVTRSNSEYGGRRGGTRAPYRSDNLFSSPGAANTIFTQNLDDYYAMKLNYVNQIDKHNLLKVGVDYYHHTIRRMQMFDVLNDPAYGDNNYIGYRVVVDTVGTYTAPNSTTTNTIIKYRIKKLNKDDYNAASPLIADQTLPLDGAKHPVSAALYLQDKLEYEGVIVNAGVRYDFFNAGTKRLRNFFNPLQYGDTTKMDAADFYSARNQNQFSPRLSVSFPVSERTIFRMSYGKFFQQPRLQDLYIGAAYLQNTLKGVGGIRSVQNPNLDAEESTQYEVGFQHGLSDYLKVDLSAYYKDVSNMTNLNNREVQLGLTGFPQYQNVDRGIIKGVTVAFELRRIHHVSGRFSYTLQTAEGTGSDPDGAFNAIWTDKQNIKFISPLDYDQRHRFNLSFDLRNGKGEGPSWGGHVLENSGINFLISSGSGFPYTPRVPSPVSDTQPAKVTGRRNSQVAPWTFRVDLKADRHFQVSNNMSVGLYVEVQNLLDRKNPAAVYAATGDAANDGYLASAEGQVVQAGKDELYPVFYNVRIKNGLNYDTPRQVRAGVVFNF